MAQLMTPEKPRERKYALVQSKYLSKMNSVSKSNLKQPTLNDEQISQATPNIDFRSIYGSGHQL